MLLFFPCKRFCVFIFLVIFLSIVLGWITLPTFPTLLKCWYYLFIDIYWLLVQFILCCLYWIFIIYGSIFSIQRVLFLVLLFYIVGWRTYCILIFWRLYPCTFLLLIFVWILCLTYYWLICIYIHFLNIFFNRYSHLRRNPIVIYKIVLWFIELIIERILFWRLKLVINFICSLLNSLALISKLFN